MNLRFKKKDLDLGFLPNIGGVRYVTYEANFGKECGMTVFCCLSASAQVIENEWQELADYINHDYLIGELSEFERWNCYLLFIITGEIPKPLKYEIENDKFAVRKIVEQTPVNWDNNSSEELLVKLLNDRLLLAHINLTNGGNHQSTNIPKLSFFGQSVIDKEIPSEPLIHESQDSRKAWIRHALKRAMCGVNNEN